ncbi:MAG: hypothetical protein K2P70_12150 [Hyphomonadaceae bacterium]|jgi:hypothetical protein|nr:hypothetical protein [Hyphomonadaceae bacterium]
MPSHRSKVIQEKMELLRGAILDGLKPGDPGYERELKRAVTMLSWEELQTLTLNKSKD